MRRLYYVADDIGTTTAISDRLHEEGITDWNFHVLSKDDSGLYSHHVHSALPYHRHDIIRSGERCAVWGSAAGLLLGAVVFATDVLPWNFSGIAVLVTGLTCGLVGGWWGCLRGLKRENYKISRFHDDIDNGRYLIMVDVRKELKTRVREIMNLEFGSVAYGGADSTLVTPFSSLQAREYVTTSTRFPGSA